jgi:hypothetical protein
LMALLIGLLPDPGRAAGTRDAAGWGCCRRRVGRSGRGCCRRRVGRSGRMVLPHDVCVKEAARTASLGFVRRS